MKKVILYIIGTILMVGCNNKVSEHRKKIVSDSLSLKVALTPTLQCLPFFYAQEIGIYKDLGLSVSFVPFNSQMDCDTALLKNRVEVSVNDIVRATVLNIKKKNCVQAFMATDGQWNLLTSDTSKFKKGLDLKKHMVVVARNSAPDWLSSAFVERLNLKEHDIFRPQINDIKIRSHMMKLHQIDATIMTEPQVQLGIMNGDRILYSTKDEKINLGCMIVRSDVLRDSTRIKQLKKLVLGYEKAIKSLNVQKKVDCDSILMTFYSVKENVLKRLKFYKYREPHAVLAKDVNRIIPWLEDRGIKKKNEDLDILIDSSIIKNYGRE